MNIRARLECMDISKKSTGGCLLYKDFSLTTPLWVGYHHRMQIIFQLFSSPSTSYCEFVR